MLIKNQTFDGRALFKLSLVAMGAFLLISPAVMSAESINISDIVTQTSEKSKISLPIITAQFSSICRPNRRWATAETENYHVYICGKQFPAIYIGIAKNTGARITLPISSYSENFYRAKNNGYSYTLNMNRKQLIIRFPNGNRIIENVISTDD